MNMESAIACQGLVKRFKTRQGSVLAVDGLDLAVLPGETFGLIGPDGAGKTTTIRVILGLLTRSAGQSHVLGFDSMTDTYAIRERAGYIAQQFALPSDLTVGENMRFFARVHGVSRPEQRRRIPELLDFAGLADFKDRPAGKLSGGMKKKLALACSLIHEPQVVLLDEPTLGVDPVSRREFWNLLGNLRAEKGLTILVTTPYMDEAERCNRVALIIDGRIVACDTPGAIKALVPGALLQFTPSDLQPAEELVKVLDGVLEVQTYGRMLHVFVDDGRRRPGEIVDILAEHGIACEGMRQIEPRMEEAFITLLRRRKDADDHGQRIAPAN
ncbi:MAG: ABC transporter ATP-binding protein [Chloroflexota bacterium]|nr:MAG: ABC transporter ATP-binding protein [Chloroflexota bacterium]